MLNSPGAVWAKSLVVTDRVGNGRGCVEAAQGLWSLVGGGRAIGCSFPVKGLEK